MSAKHVSGSGLFCLGRQKCLYQHKSTPIFSLSAAVTRLLPTADSKLSTAHIPAHQINKNAAPRLSFSFIYLVLTFKTPQNSISLL